MKAQIFLTSVLRSKRNRGNRQFDGLLEAGTGISTCGIDVEYVTDDHIMPTTDIAVTWGWAGVNEGGMRNKIVEVQEARGKHTIGIDGGTFMSWQFAKYNTVVSHRISLGPPNNLGKYNNINSPRDRWDMMSKDLDITLKQSKNTGDFICIAMQANKGWNFDKHISYDKFMMDTTKTIRKYTDMPIVARTHPLRPNDVNIYRKKLAHISNITFEQSTNRASLHKSLDDCWALVTYGSSSSVDSLVNGVHTFSFGLNSMGYDISNHDLTMIKTPVVYSEQDIQQCINDMCYTTWYPDEVKEGIPFKRLLELIK